MTVDEAVERLQSKKCYRRLYQQSLGSEVTGEDLGRALASYVRTIYSGDSPFDRYIFGDRSGLSDQARRRLLIFRG